MSKHCSWISFGKIDKNNFSEEFKIVGYFPLKFNAFNNLISDLAVPNELLDDLFTNCISKLSYVEIARNIFKKSEILGVKMYKNFVRIPKNCSNETKVQLTAIIKEDLKNVYRFYSAVRKYNNEKAMNALNTEIDADASIIRYIYSDKEKTPIELFGNGKISNISIRQ